MKNFEYYTPTKVYFGKGEEERVGQILQGQGVHKVLVLYGGNSAKKSGLLDRVEKSLQEANIDYVMKGGVHPNPRLSHAKETIALCKKEKVDFLLPVGGGSVIDEAKAVGLGLCYDGDVWDIYTRKEPNHGCVPLGCILTIAAAGSEMSWASVITNEDGWLKVGYQDDVLRPVFSILNPELLYTLPPYQTACGVVDMIMHILERFFSPDSEDDLTDNIAAAIIRNVIKNGLIVKDDPHDYNSRFELMWAGSLAHNGILNGGNGSGDWASHHIEMELSGMFDVAHGAGLAVVWPNWARYVYRKDVARFAKLGRLLFDDLADADDETAALAGIDKLEAFFRTIHMPTKIIELDIAPTETQLREMADKCTHHDTKKEGAFGQLSSNDIYNIYKSAYK